MTTTDYQAQYFAYELTRRLPTESEDKLASALVDARVTLNPHQVEAALFAFRSPLAKGALLADEVGLGKTIEAGLVLAQKWAERKRRLLVVVPANLRKQWYQELTEKFFLPCLILETKPYREAKMAGITQPFAPAEPAVVICSYQFVAGKAHDVEDVAWDLVVLDEAHRLRNVYKPQNVTANTLKYALRGREKLLLTATPLQNSLLELYGLISLIDEHTFGDLKSFREQYANLNQPQTFQNLKARLQPLCFRTLRKDVAGFVSYTKRLPLLQRFEPEADEHQLYKLVTEYLQRENLQALPPSQRTLTTLVLRKLLASSTFAIAGALQTIAERLRGRLARHDFTEALADAIGEDYEAFDETAEEWQVQEPPVIMGEGERQAVETEIKDLTALADLAASIQKNAKGTALLVALREAFRRARENGAAEKALVFTESRKTQNYLLQLLGESEFAEGIVLFNGTNNDPGSRQIYQQWKARHQGTDRLTGSPTADMRSALVDYFRSEQGRIMIATEAGAEGINLQFCSLVVNYDLPWNPQRIEQRIGRCHRYGQKHDVVVVNFLNEKNAADQRVYDLLQSKFELFNSTFGSSDEILGAIESGVDFERRIAAIYQTCRQPSEIEAAFDRLQEELKYELDSVMKHTQRQLLDHFDEEVREKLRTRATEAEYARNRFEELLLRLTRHELRDYADFVPDDPAGGFRLYQLPSLPFHEPRPPLGHYEMPRRSAEAHYYRLGHPLALALLKQAKDRQLPPATIEFNYTGYNGRISALEPLRGQSGWLLLSCFTAATPAQTEEYLLCAARTDAGQVLDEDTAARLLRLPGCLLSQPLPANPPTELADILVGLQAGVEARISARNARFFDEEAAKLEGWADDQKLTLERDLKDLDRQLKEVRRAATSALTLQAKLESQKQQKALEATRSQKRRALFEAQDEVDRRRDDLISTVETQLRQELSTKELFVIRWILI
ncbi:DEAD/DEAH box helicase family protein [Hymenobacter sp. BT664]|uniref:DEAD/DEAH box helicase family protein n=1 Tax=Hymenobacter montanus TaxID=2771359 RepID=A0A927GIQ8_9BACT|nr:SNF2-related protein [Hymenobacter montanus]MBD2767605.1 DEAD/DEAH box helicase family protein [Hymenobacter montanus]